jgi:ubiquinone/menaquinone biosynthesis C-methylase UbiE
MASNYDHTAWFYDPVSKLIFGRSIVNSQKALLKHIPAASTILIVGGGTGWILEEIAKVHPHGLQIIYVEISAQMTALSRKRNVGNNLVTFINKPVEEVKLGQPVDIAITPFLFDNFSQDNLERIHTHIHHQLKPDGLWLNTDFQVAGKWWHKVLLLTMYTFFKVFGAVETTSMPGIMIQFKQKSYRILSQQTFYGSFITSQVWQKPTL